jgi:hypothetical protein
VLLPSRTTWADKAEEFVNDALKLYEALLVILPEVLFYLSYLKLNKMKKKINVSKRCLITPARNANGCCSFAFVL